MRLLTGQIHLDRFASELEKMDDPDVILKDWVTKCALPALRSSDASRDEIISSCKALLQRGLVRLQPGEVFGGLLEKDLCINSDRQRAAQKVR